MKKLISTLACTGLMAAMFGLVGCGDTSTVESEKKVSGPGGTTTIKDTKEVKQSGDNPPPASESTPPAPKG
jgi:hypothetical protein